MYIYFTFFLFQTKYQINNLPPPKKKIAKALIKPFLSVSPLKVDMSIVKNEYKKKVFYHWATRASKISTYLMRSVESCWQHWKNVLSSSLPQNQNKLECFLVSQIKVRAYPKPILALFENVVLSLKV
jgi:hypothetical protein